MFDSLKAFFWRGQFDGAARRDFYTALGLQLKAGIQLKPACDSLYDIYSEEGRKPRRIHAMVAQDCAAGLADGRPIYETLAQWVPYDEQSSIEAGAIGSTTGNSGESTLGKAFDRAKEIVKRKEQMRNAMIAATAYPCFLLTGAFAAFYYVATAVLPQLLSAGRRPGTAVEHSATEAFAIWFGTNGMYVGFATVALVLLIFLSFPRLTGPVRVVLDRYTPWKTYRTIQGAIFVYNVGAMLTAGMGRVQMLERMMRHANPYVRERIEAALVGVRDGKDLGHALYLAGHNFPSTDAIALLRLIGGLRGADLRLKEFGDLWMDNSIDKLKASAAVFRNAAVIALGALVMLLASTINDLGNGLLGSFGAM